MILEVAILDVIPGQEPQFHADFQQAQQIISAMPGYIEHELQRCLEKPSRHLLLVRWQTLDDHVEGFRKSAEYQQWKQLLHNYYQPFPVVEHYELLFAPAKG
ncbi:antibiotic biosynthesis monooxygenase [Acaryochloris sp. IP29b_bin.137]|uniref:antibiotic biosynthesis monooxygenase family protein n=1 Tax=Acaryochloris sp. IP29b_bin.137 TaxID=2969217 RepID=UPI00260E55BD|nr:antibiotic biosynthesis monooxygenase [Acaryochloris sp. IP29b_bin.137]